MKFGIIVFPGTWSDKDCKYAVSDNLGQKSKYIWHKETDLFIWRPSKGWSVSSSFSNNEFYKRLCKKRVPCNRYL